MFSGIIFWVFYSAPFSSGTPFLCMLVCFITSMAMPPWTHPLVWSQKLSRLVHRASPVAQMVKNLLAMQETWVRSLRAWQPTPIFLHGESPCSEEPGRPQSCQWGHKVRINWGTEHPQHMHHSLSLCSLFFILFFHFLWIMLTYWSIFKFTCFFISFFKSTVNSSLWIFHFRYSNFSSKVSICYFCKRWFLSLIYRLY